MLRASLLTLGLLLGCGGREATSLTTDLGAVEVVVPPPKPNPFTTPCLQVVRALSLPDAKARCSRSTVDAPVTNTCAFPVRLSSDRSGPFGVARLPLELAPNASETATFAFLPTSSGPQTATLQLVAQADGHTQTTPLLLDATATEPRTGFAETRAPVFAPDEMLIIIDDDGLPDADQQIAEMALLLTGSPRHVVVSDLSGNLQRPDGVAVLASDSPTFVDRVTRALHPPRSSGVRSCFETALRLKNERQPAGFWNPRSRRTIACITNEVDQSNVPASSMVGAWNVPMDAMQTAFLVIAPFADDSCGVADARLERLALATGGLREALCMRNWGRAIQYLDIASEGWHFGFQLPPTPRLRSADSLSVTMDGVALPRWAWLFNPVINTILLPAEPERLFRATWETCDD